MLYVISLSIMAKKALGPNKAMTVPLSKVISQLPLDPKTTNMDAVLLGPSDMAGVNKAKITKALEAGVHPGICLMYMYTKESEAKDLSFPYMKGVRKINVDEIEKFVTDSMDDFMSKSGQLEASLDTLLGADDMETVDIKDDTPSEVEMDDTSYIPEPPKPEVQESPQMTIEPMPQPKQEVPAPESVAQPKPIDRQEMLENIKSYEDWTLLRQALEKDHITAQLIQENSEYNGAIQMLEVMDNKIKTIWMDNSLSAEKKLEQITQVGCEKSTLRATANSIMVSKVMDILETTAVCAKRVVTDTVEDVNMALAKITTDSKSMLDDSSIIKANQERIDLQLQLQSMLLDLRKLYGDMDDTAHDTIVGLTEGLPSNNAFINNMLTPADTSMFTPTNTTQLVNKLLTKLQDNTVTMSALEEKLDSIIRLIFAVFDTDAQLLQYHQNLEDMLRANRVEDVVVRDTVLKYVLRVYIGADDTGRTATALTWSGVQSRMGNTLLIDLSGNPHFDRYGVEAVPLNEFLAARIQKPFLCVASERRLDGDELQQVISELRSRLNYYSIVNVIVQPDDKVALSMLAQEAISFNYITDCRGRSIDAIRECMGNTCYENLSKRLIEIDAPINPLQIAEAVGADFTKIRVITLPNMPIIRACALKKDRPYEYSEVQAIFEEAFR